MLPAEPGAENAAAGVDITSPGVPVEPPVGLSDRELADWYREQLTLRDEDLARLKVLLAEREAEVQRLQRETTREASARGRAEVAEAQVAALRRELAVIREGSTESLAKAEE